MRLLFGLILSAAFAAAQQQIDLSRKVCLGSDLTKSQVVIFIPLGTVSAPICATIGAGLRLNMTAIGGPAIESTSTAPTPTYAEETLALDPAKIPLTQGTVNYVLAQKPAAGTAVCLNFVSSIFPGGDTKCTAAASITNNQLTITLPLSRSQVAGDIIVFRYFF